jgi:hypothetical protein
VQIGRWETPTRPRDKMLQRYMVSYARQAEPLYRDRWPDQLQTWEQWNVAVLKGPVQQCREVLFQWWRGLGWEVFPVFVAQVRYTPAIFRAEREVGRTTDPAVLHRAWDFVGTDPVPGDPRTVSLQRGWRERFLAFGSQIGRTGICDHPGAQTQRGLERVLAMRRLEVHVDPYGTPKLRPLVKVAAQ